MLTMLGIGCDSKMSSIENDPKVTAMHEAAHAIIALNYGFNIKAQVVDEEDSNGYMDYDGELTPNIDAVVSLAGFVIEVNYLNVPKARAMRHASSDMEDVDAASRKAMGTFGGRKLFKSQAMSVTKMLIAKHMPKIEKVASQLLSGNVVEITVEQFNEM